MDHLIKQARDAITVAMGDIVYLANERNELPRFEETLNQLQESHTALDQAMAARGDGCMPDYEAIEIFIRAEQPNIRESSLRSIINYIKLCIPPAGEEG